MISMISPEEAKSKVLERSRPLEIRHVSLEEAQGYVVAEDIVAESPRTEQRSRALGSGWLRLGNRLALKRMDLISSWGMH
jgi:hypothetical protein